MVVQHNVLKSASWCFKPGEGPSRGLLSDCENFWNLHLKLRDSTEGENYQYISVPGVKRLLLIQISPPVVEQSDGDDDDNDDNGDDNDDDDDDAMLPVVDHGEHGQHPSHQHHHHQHVGRHRIAWSGQLELQTIHRFLKSRRMPLQEPSLG